MLHPFFHFRSRFRFRFFFPLLFPCPLLPCSATIFAVESFFLFVQYGHSFVRVFTKYHQLCRPELLFRNITLTMHMLVSFSVLLSASVVSACGFCYGPTNYESHSRSVRRQQPEALNATTKPRAPLEWGQLNFLHTTDTHGWLEGHLKEQNYGADWGDYVSFTRRMKQRADSLGVDLLLVDTGRQKENMWVDSVSRLTGTFR